MWSMPPFIRTLGVSRHRLAHGQRYFICAQQHQEHFPPILKCHDLRQPADAARHHVPRFAGRAADGLRLRACWLRPRRAKAPPPTRDYVYFALSLPNA